MNGRTQSGAGASCPASSDVAAMEAALERHAGQLGDIRRHAVSVTLLRWESPAGENFRSYLFDRCAELSRTIDLLESASRHLADYRRLVHAAEMLQPQAGQ